jgi:hypothetical protein
LNISRFVRVCSKPVIGFENIFTQYASLTNKTK